MMKMKQYCNISTSAAMAPTFSHTAHLKHYFDPALLDVFDYFTSDEM